MIKKGVIIAILATFCLTATLFIILPIKSSPSAGEYNPWADIDDNGKIDMKDIGITAKMFGASGDPTKLVKVGSYDSNTSTQNITIPAHTSGNINITTDGYSRMTLGLTTSVGVTPINVNTGFMIGSFYAHMDGIDMGGTGGTSSKPANAIWLEPSTIPLMGKSVGYKFNVTAWINLTSTSFTWQVKCNFDGTVFRATRGGYTAGSKSQFFSGHSTVNSTFPISSSSVAIGESLIGTDSRSAGSDSLCWFEFELTGSSTEEQLSINNVDTFVLNRDLNEIPTTKYDALASWNVSTYGTYEMFKTYSVLGPILRIDYYNPNDNNANLKIDTYLTTAP